jgi:hypothetical protein
MLIQPSPNQNKLLAALSRDEFDRLAPLLDPVQLSLGEMLYEPGQQMRHAYFPITAWLALRCSWAESPPLARPWCKLQEWLIASKQDY